MLCFFCLQSGSIHPDKRLCFGFGGYIGIGYLFVMTQAGEQSRLSLILPSWAIWIPVAITLDVSTGEWKEPRDWPQHSPTAIGHA